MLLMTLRDLQFRSRRILIVVAGTTLVFALLLLMSGMAAQFVREPRQAVKALGASTWVVRDGASGAFTSAATIDPRAVDHLGGDASPIVTARHALERKGDLVDVVLIGHVPGGLGSPQVVAGKAPESAGEIALDESAKQKPGSRVVIGGETFTVTGTTSNTTLFAGMPMVYMSLPDVQQLVYKGEPVITAVLMSEPASAMPEGLAVLTPEQIAADAMRPLEHAITSVNLIRTLLWIVSAMIIGGVVFLSAMERRRDFAVLKAAGATTRWLLGGLALQSVAMALAAAVLSLAVQRLLVPAFPLKVTVSGGTMIQLPAIAVLVALLAGAGGLRQVAKTDPASAFSGPGA